MRTKRIAYFSLEKSGKIEFAIAKQYLTPEMVKEFYDITNVVYLIQPTVLSLKTIFLNFYELNKALSTHNSQLSNLQHVSNCGLTFTLDLFSESIQKINNTLSSISSFLSCTQANISQSFGNNSAALKSWNVLRNKLHQENFCYRFLYELRNYSQHKNIPVQGYRINVEGMQSTKPAAENKLYVSKKDLLDSGYNWRSLKEEIIALPEKFDLMPYLEQYISVISRIFLKYIDLYKNDLFECGEYLKALKRVNQFPEHSTPIIYNDKLPEGTLLNADIEYIPYQQYSWIIATLTDIRNLTQQA